MADAFPERYDADRVAHPGRYMIVATALVPIPHGGPRLRHRLTLDMLTFDILDPPGRGSHLARQCRKGSS